MRDSAVVLSVDNQLAWVRVTPQAVCGECSARSFCLGRQDTDGRIAVSNPLRAKPGDEVEIEVPEAKYELAMRQIFGLPLAASLVGFGLGYWVHPLSFLSSNANALIGFLVGLFFSGAAIFYYHNKQKGKAILPVIVEILSRGGSHGQA